MHPNAFSPAEIEGVNRAIRERRDMRHFLSTPIPPEQLERFIGAAHQAPSVGLMQPWRFIRITDSRLRRQIHAHVDEERAQTAHALEQRAQDFMRLKVEGILECAELLVVALVDKREPYVFGRRTMPDDSAPIAVLCVGHVERFYPAPMLEAEGWDRRRPVAAMVYEDTWGKPAALADGTPA